MAHFPTPPAPGTADASTLLAHMRELGGEQTAPVRRQHVVSQVLLRRFTAPGPRSSGAVLAWIDLRHPERHQKNKGTGAFGWQPNFVPFASGSLEALWGETEHRIPTALASLDAGTAPDDPETVAILRDTVALHFIRSLRFRDMHHQAWEQAYAGSMERMLTVDRHRFTAAVLHEFGLAPATPEAAEELAQRFLAVSDEAFQSGAVLRTSIEERFHRARELLAHRTLSVITPVEGEFLIGDNPVLTLRYTGAAGSGEFGVPIGNAHLVVLPAGPRHLIIFGDRAGSIRLPQDQVDAINRVQIRSATRYVHFRPGSALPRFVRQVCAELPSQSARHPGGGPLRHPDSR